MPTEFQCKVYGLCRCIPRGRVSTYREIGRKLGKGQVFRAVGRALANNPFSPRVPCHRVVRSDGRIGGFMGVKNAVQKKIKLLEQEGVKVKNGRVVDFRKKLFTF